MTPSSVPSRRRDYVEQTRAAILDSAETYFVRDGYRAASVDAIAANAGFTKGAVYRHFDDKRALFEAVFARVETDMINSLPALTDAVAPGDRTRQALALFLHASTQHRFRRIVLEEGPTALGQSRWRDLDEHHTGAYLQQLLAALMESGTIARRPLRPLARLCCAIVGEAAILISEAADPATAETDAGETLNAMLSGLATERADTSPST